MRRRADDDLFPGEDMPPAIGACAVLGGDGRAPAGWTPPEREFPPGFHVAAPGPSHPEPAPKRRRRPAGEPR